MPKPQPVVVTTVCSLCDEPWEDHGDKPTTEDCIRLLKAKLARTQPVIYRDRWYPAPTYVPTPSPWWNGTLTVSNSHATSASSFTVNYRRPDDGTAVPAAA